MPLLFILFLFHFFSSDSYGYVDPGSGHLIWQMLLSMAFGGLFYFRRAISYLFRPAKDRAKRPE